MRWDTMFGEYILDEELCKDRRIYGVCGGDEYGLFGQPVDDNKNGCEARGFREVFNEVHQDGIPGT